AWNAVSDEIRAVCDILADEMALTNLEVHLGAPRAAAMRHMADRTGAEDLTALVSTIVQSERFGTSIGDALKAAATSMREVRSQRAEESAEKMPVKLLFPLVLFLFPAVLIVIAGPAAIEWSNIIANS
ncbi:MAG: type II secretion system F family protein, partial [Planctomycetota bacterium]|nr:type II secretion system F family protein [Planctomycetota bacterium]